MIVAPVFRLSGLPASELKRTNLPPPVTFPNFQMENIRFVDRIVVLSGERKANKKATDRSVALKGSLSGYRDSNSGPPTPEAGALTGLRYTPRQIERKYSNYSLCAKEIFRFILRLSEKRGCDFFLFHLKYWYVVCCCSLSNIEKKWKKWSFSWWSRWNLIFLKKVL